MKEYRVELKIKNNLLLSAIENAGFKSIAEFSRDIGVHMQSIHRLITLKEAPLRQDGTFTTTAQKLLDYFCALPEDLWSEEQLWNTLTTNKGQVLLDKHQMSVLTYGGDEETLSLEDMVHKKEIQEKVHEVLHTLSPKEAKIIKMRYGMDGSKEHNLEEVGRAFDVTRERVRQLEHKGLMKLREAHRKDKLMSCLDIDTFSSKRSAAWHIFVARKKPAKEFLDACEQAFYYAYDRAIQNCEKRVVSRSHFWNAYRHFNKIPLDDVYIIDAFREGWKQGVHDVKN